MQSTHACAVQPHFFILGFRLKNPPAPACRGHQAARIGFVAAVLQSLQSAVSLLPVWYPANGCLGISNLVLGDCCWAPGTRDDPHLTVFSGSRVPPVVVPKYVEIPTCFQDPLKSPNRPSRAPKLCQSVTKMEPRDHPKGSFPQNRRICDFFDPSLL